MRQQTVVSGKGRPGSHGISRDYGGIRVRIQEMILQKIEAEYEVKHLPAQIKKWNSRYADAVEYVYENGLMNGVAEGEPLSRMAAFPEL